MSDASRSADGRTPQGRLAEEHALSSRLRAREPEAFEEMVRVHQPAIARLAFRLLGWSEDANDVVQEVFLAAWKALPRFRLDSSLATWLTRITVNQCRSHRRRAWLHLRFLRRGARPEPLDRPADVGPMDAERLDRVRRTIRALPVRLREVITLHYLQELSLAETAEVLKTTESAVMNRLHRARLRLKDMLGDVREMER